MPWVGGSRIMMVDSSIAPHYRIVGSEKVKNWVQEKHRQHATLEASCGRGVPVMRNMRRSICSKCEDASVRKPGGWPPPKKQTSREIYPRPQICILCDEYFGKFPKLVLLGICHSASALWRTKSARPILLGFSSVLPTWYQRETHWTNHLKCAREMV